MRALLPVVVTAFVVGCGSSGGQSANGHEIVLPNTLGDYTNIVEVPKAERGVFLDTKMKIEDSRLKLTAAAYNKAYGGAAATYQA